MGICTVGVPHCLKAYSLTSAENGPLRLGLNSSGGVEVTYNEHTWAKLANMIYRMYMHMYMVGAVLSCVAQWKPQQALVSATRRTHMTTTPTTRKRKGCRSVSVSCIELTCDGGQRE